MRKTLRNFHFDKLAKLIVELLSFEPIITLHTRHKINFTIDHFAQSLYCILTVYTVEKCVRTLSVRVIIIANNIVVYVPI